MAVWHTVTTLREQWSGAPSSDPLCTELLEVAKLEVLSYGETGLAGEANATPPAGWRFAQMKLARAIWETNRANEAGEGDSIGSDGFQVPRSSDWSASIRRLIRPPSMEGVG